MDLTRHLLADLSDVTTLYERRLCSLGVVRLKLDRAGAALRMQQPGWTEALAALSERVRVADEAKVEWLAGMELMDAIRGFVKSPPAREAAPVKPVAPVLSLVEEEVPQQAAVEGALPTDPSEPALPRGLPVRNL